MPRFANETYRAWRRRHPARGGGERVILWPDTFNNYFRPETAIAATRLLEGLGFQVDIPAAPLCCGRPLYDWGWVDQAKAPVAEHFESDGGGHPQRRPDHRA